MTAAVGWGLGRIATDEGFLLEYGGMKVGNVPTLAREKIQGCVYTITSICTISCISSFTASDCPCAERIKARWHCHFLAEENYGPQKKSRICQIGFPFMTRQSPTAHPKRLLFSPSTIQRNTAHFRNPSETKSGQLQ